VPFALALVLSARADRTAPVWARIVSGWILLGGRAMAREAKPSDRADGAQVVGHRRAG